MVDDEATLSVDDTPSAPDVVELATGVVAESAGDVEEEMAASLSLVEEGSEAVGSLWCAKLVHIRSGLGAVMIFLC